MSLPFYECPFCRKRLVDCDGRCRPCSHDWVLNGSTLTGDAASDLYLCRTCGLMERRPVLQEGANAD
jgi:hypothetical protein